MKIAAKITIRIEGERLIMYVDDNPLFFFDGELVRTTTAKKVAKDRDGQTYVSEVGSADVYPGRRPFTFNLTIGRSISGVQTKEEGKVITPIAYTRFFVGDKPKPKGEKKKGS